MFNFDTLIKNIENDKRTKLIGLFGSYANNTNNNLSDIDIFVILDGVMPLEIEGIHFQSSYKEEVDFLLISEDKIHSKRLPKYIELCILNNSKILYSSCETCRIIIENLQFPKLNSKLSSTEAENIFWHLRHIIYKAEKFNNDSVELKILWAKFLYFLSLLWPRFFNKEVQGELHFLKHSYGNKLKEFIINSNNNIPALSEWYNILKILPISKNIKKGKMFCEVDNLIQPYTPVHSISMNKNIYKKIVKGWLKI